MSDVEASNPVGGRKPPKLAMKKRSVTQDSGAMQNNVATAPPNNMNNMAPYVPPQAPINPGRKIVPVHESRIKDRPEKTGEKDSSLKIKIELDLEVEVELYARVKGDITIGLM